ncbi:DUF4873 domain-containing protein [Pseudonocardia nigra]|uniref:DUF4873 domain-containing protein n=1 Tax=Pseudonocardia nigra TaxID=1921578 RepID=UPI001C5EAF03|nr:DUF4873 domain-containing protein [Pseudonocardia nigra]
MADDHDEHDEGYTGPATLTVDGRDVRVRAILDARHEPQDGRLHWFGRVAPEDGAGEDVRTALGSASSVEVRTAGGRATARIGDVDPWGRYRVTGVGRPPFTLEEPALDD